MRKIFFLFVAVLLTANIMAERTANVIGNLNNYKYFYVVPTSGVTSSSGAHGSVYGGSYGISGNVYSGATKTIVPSDAIGGYLMQHGYNLLSSVVPEKADETLIVTYGYIGRRQLSTFSYASCIIIQMRNAQTQDLVASYETEGCGSDETEDIHLAIQSALELFTYSMSPIVIVDVVATYKNYLIVTCTNKTIYPVNNVELKITYTLDGEVIHNQFYSSNARIGINDQSRLTIYRDKVARNRKYEVQVEIINYK